MKPGIRKLSHGGFQLDLPSNTNPMMSRLALDAYLDYEDVSITIRHPFGLGGLSLDIHLD